MDNKGMANVHNVSQASVYTEMEPIVYSKLQDSTTVSYEEGHFPYQQLQSLILPAKIDDHHLQSSVLTEKHDDGAYHPIPAVHITHAQYSQMDTANTPLTLPLSTVEMGPEMSEAVDSFVKNVVAVNEQKLLEEVRNLQKESTMRSMLERLQSHTVENHAVQIQGIPLTVTELNNTEPQMVTSGIAEGQFVAIPSQTSVMSHAETVEDPVPDVSDEELLNLHICDKSYVESESEIGENSLVKPYYCGGCSIKFDTICVLHDHLQTHTDGGSYHYDHFFKTAFPKCDTFCQYVQTDDTDIGRDEVTDMVLCDDESDEKTHEKTNVNSEDRKSKRKLGNPRKCVQSMPSDTENKLDSKLITRADERKSKRTNIYLVPPEVRETEESVTLSQKQKNSKVKRLDVEHKQSESVQTSNSKRFKKSNQHGKGKGTKSKANKNNAAKCPSNSNNQSNNKAVISGNKLEAHENTLKDVRSPEDSDKDITDTSSAVEIVFETDGDNDEVQNTFDSDIDDNEMTKCLINESITHLDNEDKENESEVAENVKRTVDLTKSYRKGTNIKMEPQTGENSGICKPFKKRGQPRKSDDQMAETVKREKKPKQRMKAESKEEVVTPTAASTVVLEDKVPEASIDDRKERGASEPSPRFTECETCGESMPRYKYINHIRKHTGEKPFVCEKCGKTFARNRFLTKHLITHEDVKPWKCHLCPAGFCQKNEFKMHMAGHTGYRPHQCKVCDASFLSKTTLQTHVANIHMGETRFECNVCHRRFFKKSSLKIHVATHFEATIKCGYCEKMFKDRSGLKRHERIHTGVKLFQCHICSHAFIQSTPFWSHMEKRHNLGRREVKAYRREVSQLTRGNDTVFRPSREDSLPAYKVQPTDIKIAVTETEMPDIKFTHEAAVPLPLSYAMSSTTNSSRDVNSESVVLSSAISRHAVTDTKQLQYEDTDQSKLLDRALAHQLQQLTDIASRSGHMMTYAGSKPFQYTIEPSQTSSPVPETTTRQPLPSIMPSITEAVTSHHLHMPAATLAESDIVRHQYMMPVYQIPSTIPEPASSNTSTPSVVDSKLIQYADAENNALHALYHNPLMFVANLASAYPSDIAGTEASSVQHVISYSKI